MTALEKGLDIAKISGSGPNSRIILADVEEALKAGPVKQVETKASVAAVAQPVKAAPSKVDLANFDDLDVSQIRKVIAERLTFSK